MGTLSLQDFSEKKHLSQVKWQRFAGAGIVHHAPGHKWSDTTAVGVFAVILLEMLVPVGTLASVIALMLFAGICVLKSNWPAVSRGLLLFALPAGAFLITACLNGIEYNVVRVDAVNIVQTVVLMAFLGWARFDDSRRERFLKNVHIAFLVLGVTGAAAGLIKLFLDSRGIQIGFLFDKYDRYPAGSSLRSDYNIFTSAIVLSLCSAFWLMPRTRSRFILHLCHMGWPVLATAAVLTGSRRAPIFLAIGLLVGMVALIRGRRRRFQEAPGKLEGMSVNRWLMTFYCLCLLSVAFYAPPVRRALEDLVASTQVNSLLDRSSTVSSVAQLFDTRLLFWDYSLHEIGNRDMVSLLLGNGFTYVADLGHLIGELEAYPHNFVFSAMLYGGVLQTLLLLSVIAIAFTRAFHAAPSARFLFFWLLVAVLFSLSSNNSFFSSELGLAAMVLALDAPRRTAPGRFPRRTVRNSPARFSSRHTFATR
jgi:hypothetical protein